MAGQLINAGGEQFVLLPLSEYESLAKAARHLAAGFPSPSLVLEFDGSPPAITEGESSLRAWRKHRGMTLEQLAAAVGKTKGFLSEVENGHAFGKPGMWLKLARALNTEVEAILPEYD